LTSYEIIVRKLDIRKQLYTSKYESQSSIVLKALLNTILLILPNE